MKCSCKLNSSPRQTLYDKKTHICCTPQGLWNYCKLVTSLTALTPLGAFQLLNREEVLIALLKYCLIGIHSSACSPFLLTVWKMLSSFFKCKTLNDEEIHHQKLAQLSIRYTRPPNSDCPIISKTKTTKAKV